MNERRLPQVDLSKHLNLEEAEAALVVAQRRLLALRLTMGGLIGDGVLGPPVLCLFEGWDAAGKGGSIKRLVEPLDPRHVRVVEFAAPTDQERRHHFLWRFMGVLPGWGGMTVFDRSWYGRVLVERVEGFSTDAEWGRSYDEIVNFEKLLVTEGTVLVKIWCQISKDEQLRRFEERRGDPLKSWKLTPDDWRNRERWDQYEVAVEDMFERTDWDGAPWHLVATEHKHEGRVEVLRVVTRAIEDGMRRAGIDVPA